MIVEATNIHDQEANYPEINTSLQYMFDMYNQLPGYGDTVTEDNVPYRVIGNGVSVNGQTIAVSIVELKYFPFPAV